ncbi:Helicase Sen1 N-terminal protein [Rutstroemia sp. NJR-2017a BBW]|nr:Helicase Sen1 N-terminal protein [Rutstroemia sp. NJR-2017a BBW]
MSPAEKKAEQEKTLATWYERPRGADFPSISTDIGDMNRPRKAILLVRAGNKVNSVDFEVKVKFGMYSQAPFLKIIFGDDGEEMETDVGTFRCNNFAVPGQEDPAAAPLPRFRGRRVRMDLEPENSQKAASKEFTPVDNEAKMKHGKLEQLKALLNYPMETYVTLIRRDNDQFDVHDNHWMGLMELACERGPYWFYEQDVGKVPGRLFEQWGKRPNSTVRRQEWMRKVRSLPEAMEFASHPAQRSYGTPQEMEMALSLAVVGEMMWESVSIKKYFVHTVRHVGTVLERKGTYVQMAISVEKLDDVQMPLVGVGTSMTVEIKPIKAKGGENPLAAPPTDVQNYPTLPATAVGTSAATPTEAEESFQTVESKKKIIQTPVDGWAANKRYRARCIDIATTQDFVIGFNVKDGNEIKAFYKHGVLEITLEMARNSLPSLRQLQAIGRLCSKADTPSEKMMQEFIMGYGEQVIAPTVDERCKPGLSQAEGRALQDSWARLASLLNVPQKAAFTAIFKSTKNFMTVIEGLSGAGKTDVMANIGVLFAQYKIRTVMTAPSNTAAQQLMVKVHQALEALYQIQPAAKDWFDVVFVPTSAATKSDLHEFSLQQLNTDFVVEGNTSSGDKVVDSYRLWAKILARYKYLAEEDPHADASEQSSAEKWLCWQSSLLAHRRLKDQNRKKFYDGIHDMAKKILSPRGNVRIVVTTCNSAALLNDYMYTPEASLVDEAAFANMSDALVPMTLGAKYHVLAGDHHQLQPVVRSMGHSEYAATYGLSAYAKFYGNPLANTIRLKINYRMHEDIADLPGILTYTFMACDPCTSEESITFQLFKEWYASQFAKVYRDARRDPAYGKAKDESRIRRLFFNVKNGMSAPKKGGTSKRNFANINAIVDFLISLVKNQSLDPNDPVIPMDHITILTPYKDEVTELTKQVRDRLRFTFEGFNKSPRFRTIDGAQGSENEIVILGLTPADRHNGSIIGFLKEWNRMNVALTRAKSVLLIFGNLDCWRSQLKVIGDVNTSRNFAYMVVDLLDRGDIIDVNGLNTLPKTKTELNTGNWTMEIENTSADNSKLTAKGRAIMKEYKTKEAQDAYERQLLAELQRKRDEAGTQEIQMYIKDLTSEDIVM